MGTPAGMKRQWVARCQYEGKKPFLFGTLEVEHERELQREYERRWAGVSPHPAAPVLEMLPGMLVFAEEGEG